MNRRLGLEREKTRLERAVTPHQARTINLVNSLETFWQRDVSLDGSLGFIGYLSGRGYQIGESFHGLWRDTPSIEKKHLWESCLSYIEENGFEFEMEEWIELGQLASHVSANRAMGQPLSEIKAAQVGQSSAVLVNGKEEAGFYRRSRRDIFISRISADPLAQALDNLIANGQDAIDPDNQIGMFASGVKVLETLPSQAVGEIKVVSKVADGESSVLRVRRSLGGRTYVNVTPMSRYPLSDIADVATPSGTRVYVTGLDLTPERQKNVLSNLSFQSGIIGRSVLLNISDQPAERVSNKTWGRKNKSTELSGVVEVEVSGARLQVVDTGSGMTREQLYKLFVPRQGTKSPRLLSSEETKSAIGERGFLETIKGIGEPQVVLKRRSEVLKRISLDPYFQGIFPGCIGLEWDLALRPAGEGRGQSGIFIDANFPEAITVFVEKILLEKYPDEEKAVLITTLFEAIKKLQEDQTGLSTTTSRILKMASAAIIENSAGLVDRLSRKYFLIPGDRVYSKLIPAERLFFPMSKEIIDSRNAFYIDTIGERLAEELGVTAADGYRVYTADMNVGAVRLDNASLKRLATNGMDSLPVIIDTDLRLVMIDRKYWEAYLKLARTEASENATERDQKKAMLCRQALQGLVNKLVMTDYEIEGVHDRKLSVRLSPLDPDLMQDPVSETEILPAAKAKKRGIYLEEYWKGSFSHLFPAGYENDIAREALARFDTLETGSLRDDPNQMIPFTYQGESLCLVGNYAGVDLCRRDEKGEISLLRKKLIEKNPDSHDLDLELRGEGGKQVLIVYDRKQMTVGFFPLADLIEGRLPQPVMHKINGHFRNFGLNKTDVSFLYSNDHPIVVIKKENYRENQFGFQVYRLDSHEEFTAAEFVKTDQIVFIQVGFVSGEESMFISTARNDEQIISGYRFDKAGRMALTAFGSVTGGRYIYEAKLVNLSGRDFLIGSSWEGDVIPMSITSDGSLTQHSSFRIYPQSDEKTGTVQIDDVVGSTLLCTSPRTGKVAIVDLDPVSGKVISKAVATVAVGEYGVSSLNGHFVDRAGGLSVLFSSSYRGYGYLDVLQSESKTVLRRVLPEGHHRRGKLLKKYREIITSPAFMKFPPEAIRLAFEMSFERIQPYADQERFVKNLQILAKHWVIENVFRPELMRFVYSLPEDRINSCLTHSLVNLIFLCNHNSLPVKTTHLESAFIGYIHSEINQDYYKLFDTLNLETIMPLLEDRMKFYEVVYDLFDSRQVKTSDIERLAAKLVRLAEKDMLLPVIDSLFSAYPVPFDTGQPELVELLTPEKLPLFRYLTTEAEFVRALPSLELPANRMIPVSGLAFMGKIMGARSVYEMDLVAKAHGSDLESFLNEIPDLSEFDQDWRIAVHFSGINGVEEREIIQNADDAIQRRHCLYGESFTGRVSYDYYTQEVDGREYFVRDITDNGCGMSDFARLCFAVSGLSDKGEFNFGSQSGEFGVGFSSNYKDADIVIVDTVRIVDEKHMKKGWASDIYSVERDGAGHALRLYQVGKHEDDSIDQQRELGTRIRIFKPAEKGIPDLDAILSANTSRKFGWITSVTSLENHPGSPTVPVEIYHVKNETGNNWTEEKVSINYRPVVSVALSGSKTATAYEGDGSIPAQVCLDGRWLSDLTPEIMSLAHPTARDLVRKYHLVVNLHGFTPTVDRGAVLETEEEKAAIAQLLTRIAANKTLTDSSYLPLGMPVDFRQMPWYVDVFVQVDARVKSLVKWVNDGGVLDIDKARFLGSLSNDEFNFVLAGLEDQTDKGPMSMLMERTIAFAQAYREKMAYAQGPARLKYQFSLEKGLSVAREVASDQVLAYLSSQDFSKWFTNAMHMIEVFDNIASNEVVDVTREHAKSDQYCFIVEMFGTLGIKNIKIVRGMKAGGVSFGGTIWLSESVINDPGFWPELLIHEPAHEIERKLQKLGIGSRFTHQQEGGFATAHKLVSQAYLNKLADGI